MQSAEDETPSVLEEKAKAADRIRIRCPYCFQTFTDREVIFRSNFKYEENEIGGLSLGDLVMGGDQENAGDADDKTLFAPYGEPYQDGTGKRDRQLEEFWENRGRENGFISADPKWNYPHIDPADPETFQRMILKGGGADEDGFVRDADGWIRRVNGKYEDNALEMTRLCPHCHNPLPFADYGKYPVKIISIVGIRGSGKTVYLDQLLSRFMIAISHTGYIMGATTYSAGGTEHVEKGRPLPPSTDDRVMRRPAAFTIRKPDDPGKNRTIVFYDIAGENCVPPEAGDGGETTQNSISSFIGQSDGLLFLIDPEQVPVFARGDGRSEREVQDVINVVNRIMSAAQRTAQNWDHIPVAVVLTKSDLLEGRAEGMPPAIFRHMSDLDAAGHPVSGFNKQEFTEIDSALRHAFAQNTQYIMPALAAFGRKGFFAVSAITCGVEERFERYRNFYRFDDENRKKFHMYRDLIAGWNSRSPEERMHYAEWRGIRCADGSRLMEERTWENCNLLIDYGRVGFWDTETEVTADYISQYGNEETIHLTVGDLTKNIVTEVYPKDDPNPRRVEEPFLWILWEMGLIPPYYTAAPFPEPAPEKKFLESQTKFERRLGEYEARAGAWQKKEEENRRHFYGFSAENENPELTGRQEIPVQSNGGYYGGQPENAEAQGGWYGGQPENAEAQGGWYGGRPENAEAQGGWYGGQPENAEAQGVCYGGQPENPGAQGGYFGGQPRE